MAKHHEHIDPRLRTRLRIYFLIAAILVGIVFKNIFIGDINFFAAVGAMVVGAFIGMLSSRMFHFSWDHDAKKVISKLDWYGAIILVLYILFEVGREKIVGFLIHGPEVAAASFAVLAGAMVGRFIGTRGHIRRILKEQQVFGK